MHERQRYELDEAAGELRRNGSLVRLPRQPFQVLQLLVRNAGQVADRNRIRREVWGETVVDFDRSLNVCIAQIRAALQLRESPHCEQRRDGHTADQCRAASTPRASLDAKWWKNAPLVTPACAHS